MKRFYDCRSDVLKMVSGFRGRVCCLLDSPCPPCQPLAMDLADYVRMANEDPALRFLVIGGYAVAAHGHVRATFDVDFLADRSERDRWYSRVEKWKLNVVASNDVFAQLAPSSGGADFDLMFVGPETFQPMFAGGVERSFGEVSAKVPSLEHLLALKLHVLKQEIPHRFSKDAEDIETLIRRNNVNLQRQLIKELFLKHGTKELYETFLRLSQQ